MQKGQLDWDMAIGMAARGLNGLAWDGKDRCINLMPRSLRWHSLWHTYRYYLYGISLIYFIVGLVSIYMCWTSYRYMMKKR